ncbi:MAG TPA: hypothetical protein VEZ19_05925 [Rubrobacter sp.]|nr:hypothetical protein [Rubrobacter sp.]
MSAHTTARLAWLVCGATLAVLAAVLLLIALGWSSPLPQGRTPWRDQAVSLAGIVGAPILGGLIASRRPRNPYGWVWLVFGSGLALQLLGGSYAAYALVVDPGSLPAPRTISRLLGLGGPLALAFAPFLFLLFPTGRLPSRRWRPIAWIAAVSGAVLFALALLFDNPDTVGGAITAMAVAVATAIFAAIVISALSLLVRFRRASGVERQQLKWFALAAVMGAAYVVGYLLSGIVGELLNLDWLRGEAFWNLLDAATNMALYVAVGVAVLRYRLYDIDIIINRTLVYGSLTVLLVAAYVGGVVGLQSVFRATTGQESTLAVVASTLAIAALFGPLRRRVQRFVDRRFYRRKYDAAKTLAAFNARLRDETDLRALSDDLVGVAMGTVQPEHVSLWLRSDTAASKPDQLSQ